MSDEVKRGLEGVVVSESRLSYIDGDAGELGYRGYAIEDFAREASFEEVLSLLWNGEWPTPDEYDEFAARLADERALDPAVYDLIEELAAKDENPMAMLRTVTSSLSAHDPDADADPDDREANLAKGCRITAKLPTALAAFDRLRRGDDPVDPREDLGHAENFLYMLNGEHPDDVAANAFDTALVLHADHGLNASTFSAMVTTSTLSDLPTAAINPSNYDHNHIFTLEREGTGIAGAIDANETDGSWRADESFAFRLEPSRVRLEDGQQVVVVLRHTGTESRLAKLELVVGE